MQAARVLARFDSQARIQTRAASSASRQDGTTVGMLIDRDEHADHNIGGMRRGVARSLESRNLLSVSQACDTWIVPIVGQASVPVFLRVHCVHMSIKLDGLRQSLARNT